MPQILLFWLWPGAISLMVGFCIGFAAQALLLSSAVRRHRQRRLGRKRLSAAFKRYRGQAMIDVPSTLLGAIALNVLNFFMLALYSPAEVGYYALAFRVAVLPLVLFSASLSEVFFQKASRSYRETGSFWNEVRFNLIAAGSLSLLMFVPLAFIARPLFQFAFGDEWLLAADILIYLSPMLAIRFVSASLLTAPLVVGKPQWLFAHNVGLVAAMCAGFLLGLVLELPLKPYLLLNSALMSAVYLMFTVQVVRAARTLESPTGSATAPAAPGAPR
jgi:O-antigen/teichoic acid export membrane protein